MGSGAGLPEPDPKDVVAEFLVGAIGLVRNAKPVLKTQTKRESTDEGEHSWDAVVSYSFTYRGHTIVINRDKLTVSIDGTDVTEITNGTAFELLQDACEKRHGVQEAEGRSKREELSGAKELAERHKRYGRLAASLTGGPARKRRGKGR